MVKEINTILRELKKMCPEGSAYAASAEISTWGGPKVRYTAHVLFPNESPFKNLCEVNQESVPGLLFKMQASYAAAKKELESND